MTLIKDSFASLVFICVLVLFFYLPGGFAVETVIALRI